MQMTMKLATPQKPPKLPSTSIRLEPTIKRRINAIIRNYGVTQTDIIERALADFIERVEQQGYPGPKSRRDSE